MENPVAPAEQATPTCVGPDETMRRMMAHRRLDPDEAVIAACVSKLKPPGYYRSGFSEQDLTVIHEEVSAGAEKLDIAVGHAAKA